jgi:predicted nucleic acid-binding protein
MAGGTQPGGVDLMASSVVSNASPLIALEQIGQLPILKGLFGTVAAPPAVPREIAPIVTPPECVQE